MSPYSSTYGRFLSFDTFRFKSIKIEPHHQKSIKIDNHKKVCDRLLSISDNIIIVDWLVYTFIDNDQFLSTIGIIDMLRPAKQLPWRYYRGVIVVV